MPLLREFMGEKLYAGESPMVLGRTWAPGPGDSRVRTLASPTLAAVPNLNVGASPIVLAMPLPWRERYVPGPGVSCPRFSRLCSSLVYRSFPASRPAVPKLYEGSRVRSLLGWYLGPGDDDPCSARECSREIKVLSDFFSPNEYAALARNACRPGSPRPAGSAPRKVFSGDIARCLVGLSAGVAAWNDDPAA